MNSLSVALIVLPIASFVLARIVIALAKRPRKSPAKVGQHERPLRIAVPYAELESRDFFKPIDEMALLVKDMTASQKAEIVKKVETRLGLFP